MTSAACAPPPAPIGPRDRGPIVRVPYEAMCVTKGALRPHAEAVLVNEPTVRAFAAGTRGEAAELAFVFRGDSATTRALASGAMRRQLGVKLRAANSCNVVYVMWRLDPHPFLEVSVKHNPGKRTHEECGTDGYTKVRAARAAGVPPLAIGASHALRAEIRGDELDAWIDGELAWTGTLPLAARELDGPAGFRSDNVQLEIVSLTAPSFGDSVCRRARGDDS
jgi:hypothetical protein